MRITVIGDLHAALDNLLTILHGFRYIDAKLNWTEPDLTLIVLGDCCDRGYNSRDIYRLLIRWQEQAARFGSEVLFLIGNHEVMNVFGYSAYNSTQEYKGYASDNVSSGEYEFREAFSE